MLLANTSNSGIDVWLGKTVTECLEWLEAAKDAGIVEVTS